MGGTTVKQLKVYGIWTFTKFHTQQCYYFAAVSSQKEFACLLGNSIRHVREYSSKTGNYRELSIARANPHQLFRQQDPYVLCDGSGSYSVILNQGVIDKMTKQNGSSFSPDTVEENNNKPEAAIAARNLGVAHECVDRPHLSCQACERGGDAL